MAADPGWYPQDNGTQRYWDGTAWTDHVAPAASPDQPPTSTVTVANRLRWLKSRTAIGVAAALIGLIVGSSTATGGSDTSATQSLSAKISTLRDENAQLHDDVAQAKSAAIDQSDVDRQVAEAVSKAQAADAAAQKQAVAAAVGKAVARERAKADARVQAAKEAAAAQQPQSLVGSGSSSSSGGTDPRFRTCGEANDNGYGPYTEGVDPEYDWYIDRDGDGVVCES